MTANGRCGRRWILSRAQGRQLGELGIVHVTERFQRKHPVHVSFGHVRAEWFVPAPGPLN